MKDEKIKKLFEMCVKNEIGIVISNTPDTGYSIDIFKDVNRGFEQLFWEECCKSLNEAVNIGIKFMNKYLIKNK